MLDSRQKVEKRYNRVEELFTKGYFSVDTRNKISCFTKAIELAPGNPGLREILGYTYFESGNYEEALQSLLRVSGDRASLPDYLCLLGDVYMQLDQIDAALDSYGRARASDPHHKKTWIKIATLLDEMGRFKEARDCFLHASKLSEEPGDYLNTLYVQIVGWLDRTVGEISAEDHGNQYPRGTDGKRYKSVEYIGQGGFGRIYKAIRHDNTIVALKIPTTLDATSLRSFIIELGNWKKLSHPNIIRLLHYEIEPDPYFEMEYCEDGSLADRMMPAKPDEAARLIFRICEGLKYAHTQEIIHRDLKPHNILIKDGIPKISDWGLSKVLSESITTMNTSFSTPYAAPEQINNCLKDVRTDIWQIGVLFYELVTGTLPFDRDSQTGIIAAIIKSDPKPPGSIVHLPSDIERVILKCLEKKPDKRYQSVVELQKAIAVHLKISYIAELKNSISMGKTDRAAYYCSELVLVHLRIGDGHEAKKYLADLITYTNDGIKDEMQSFTERLMFRVENDLDLSEEILKEADLLLYPIRRPEF